MSASDRDTLTETRRLAHWGALERMREATAARTGWSDGPGERRGVATSDDPYGDLLAEWRQAMEAKREREERTRMEPGGGPQAGRLERSLVVLAWLCGAGVVGVAIGVVVATMEAIR